MTFCTGPGPFGSFAPSLEHCFVYHPMLACTVIICCLEIWAGQLIRSEIPRLWISRSFIPGICGHTLCLSLSESVCVYASVCLGLAILLPCQSSNSINTCWSRRLTLKNSSTFFLAFLALLWLVQGRVEMVTDPQAFESVEFTDSINSLMAVATIDPLFWSALLSQHSINSHQTGLIITKLEWYKTQVLSNLVQSEPYVWHAFSRDSYKPPDLIRLTSMNWMPNFHSKF